MLSNVRASYKEDTRMGHIQRERLPKSKMASSDDRCTSKMVHVLRFGNELYEELCHSKYRMKLMKLLLKTENPSTVESQRKACAAK